MALNDERLAELRKNLGSKVVNVTFKKADGSLREMRCTRRMALIPESHHPKMTRKIDPTVAIVFDLDKNDWRSFHYDSVRKFKVDIPTETTTKKAARKDTSSGPRKGR